MLKVHAPKAETIHRLAKGVVLVEELDRTHDIEDDLGVLAHEERVDGAGHFNDIVAWLPAPLIST